VARALADMRAELENIARGRGRTGNSSNRRKKEKKRKTSSSSSSESSSTSTSSSSSGHRRNKKKRKRKLAKWRPSGRKSKKITAEELRNGETLRFKTRADLIKLAAENPGALACQFLSAVRVALHEGPPTSTKDLNKVDVQRWARDSTGLKEMRDLREVQSLIMVLARINEDKLPDAVDAIAQRVKGILTAKSPKGSWEKAQVLELLASGPSVVPQTEIVLSGLGSS